jgi:2-haloalkanoic acid dehalogenase type II
MLAAMLDPGRIQAITFDCYGTLVDWEAGIRGYVAPLLARATPSRQDQADRRPVVTPDAWLERWERIQFQMLKPWRPYREILLRSYDATMQHFGLEAFVDDAPGLVRSVHDWLPFADSSRALKRLARRYRIAIVSNIDNDLLAATVGRLQAPFSSLVTAEDARAYKPDPAIFRLACERLGLPPDQILHAAFGWRYDLGTARKVGMRTCFVNRGSGPVPDIEPPDLVVSSVEALADTLGV